MRIVQGSAVWILEDTHRIRKVDAVLLDVRQSFLRIPLKRHLRECMHKCTSEQPIWPTDQATLSPTPVGLTPINPRAYLLSLQRPLLKLSPGSEQICAHARALRDRGSAGLAG